MLHKIDVLDLLCVHLLGSADILVSSQGRKSGHYIAVGRVVEFAQFVIETYFLQELDLFGRQRQVLLRGILVT